MRATACTVPSPLVPGTSATASGNEPFGLKSGSSKATPCASQKAMTAGAGSRSKKMPASGPRHRRPCAPCAPPPRRLHRPPAPRLWRCGRRHRHSRSRSSPPSPSTLPWIRPLLRARRRETPRAPHAPPRAPRAPRGPRRRLRQQDRRLRELGARRRPSRAGRPAGPGRSLTPPDSMEQIFNIVLESSHGVGDGARRGRRPGTCARTPRQRRSTWIGSRYVATGDVAWRPSTAPSSHSERLHTCASHMRARARQAHCAACFAPCLRPLACLTRVVYARCRT